MVIMPTFRASGWEPHGPDGTNRLEQRRGMRGDRPRVVDRGRGVQPRQTRRQADRSVLGLRVARDEIEARDRDAVRHGDLPPSFVVAVEKLVASQGRYDRQNPAEAHGAV